ncbi:MAG: choice-of-anchor D domain-containing protein, partial [Flavobacterium sp.]
VYTSASISRSTTTTVNGTFRLDTSGYASGTNFTYGAAGTLAFNTTGNYTVNATDVFWPFTNAPANVTIINGGVIMNAGMSRTISGNFSIANSVAFPVGGIDWNGPSETLTINGTTTLNSGGYFKDSPIFGAASTLTYNSGGVYGRGFEWLAAVPGTIGTTPGYPNNVIISNSTTLDYINTVTPGAVGNKACNGNLLVNAGSALQMNTGGVSAGGYLLVSGNFTNGGTTTLGSSAGDDLRLAADFTNTGTFNGNNKAVWFNKASGIQTITSAAGLTIPYIVFNSTGSRTVKLSAGTNLAVPAAIGGNAISFGSASDIFDINGNTLTIGTAGVANTISGSGTFSGSAASSLSLLGIGSIGTLTFTTGFDTLNTLTINRTSGAIGATLGTSLNIGTSLALTAGIINVGNFPLSIGSAATISYNSTNFVIADRANGANAALRKVFTAAPGTATPFVFPVGDGSAPNGIEYSPLSIYGSGGGYSASSYISVAVNDIKHPNMDSASQYLTRYWDISTNAITGSPTLRAFGQYTDADINAPTESNYIANVWNGTSWSNAGSVVDATNNLTSPNVYGVGIIAITAGATNHLTAALRNQDINVLVGATTYLTGATYNFGNIVVGNTNPVTFTIQNVGQQFLVVSLPSTSPSAPYVYTTAYTAGSMASGATKTFTVTFTPTAAGTFTGSIVIPSDDPDEPSYTINFTGVGVAAIPDINIQGAGNTLTTINTPLGFTDTLFPGQSIATTSAAKIYTIQNLGNTVLNVGTITITGANPGDFAVSALPSATVAASGSTTFGVTFTPSAAGTRNATITVNSDDPDELTYVFYVSGTGQDAEIEVYGNGNSIVTGDLTPSTTDGTNFGNVNVASGTTLKNFSIFNTGVVTLTISSVTITGANSADFTITTAPATSLASNVATTLGITFNPSATGVRTALVTIVNNDSNENPYTFAIQGNGVDYIPCALGANQVIAVQDFEVAAATPTMTYNATGDVNAIYGASAGTAYGVSYVTQTNKFIGARSFQMTSSTNANKTATINFNPVNTSAYQEISLSFALGAYTSAANGLDVTDEVNVYISTDGTTWSREMNITGNGDAIWDINTASGSAYSTMYDNNNITTVYKPAAVNSKNTFTRSYTLTDLPSTTQLYVRVIFSLDRSDELWALDNVTLNGKTTATTTWNGTAWSNGAPTSSVKAIINGPYTTTSGSVDACACQITSVGSVNINSGQYFDIQDNFDNSGAFTIDSSGSLVQHNNAAVNTGNNVTVKRTTAPYRKFDYTYWSSPVSNAQIGTTFTGWRTDYAFQFATANFQDLLTAATNAAPADGFDDDGNAWLNVATSTVMTPAKGYAIMAPTNVTFSPTATATVSFSGPVNNGLITIPLAQSQNGAAANDDFNLIGNPYPSALSGDAFLTQNTITSNQISGTLYFWTHNQPISNSAPGPNQYNFITADYAMYTLAGGTASGTGSLPPSGKIASGAGFFVEASNGASQATFDNTMRDKTFSNSQFFRMSSAQSQPNGVTDRVWLNFTHPNGLFSQQLIAYFPNTTLGFDPAYDGQVSVTANSVSFYSFIGDDNYRIQARPAFDATDIVPLGYKVLAPGHYDIAIAQSEGALADGEVYLEDKLLNVIHNLKDSSYSFDTEAGTFNTRFQLRYTNLLGSPDFNSADANVVVAVSNGQIKVKSYAKDIKAIAVYDILGREVYSKNGISAQEFAVENVVKNQQALIVKITLDNGVVVNRKILF